MSTNTTAATAMHGTAAAMRLIVASSVGNGLEFYEILVYGYFAVTISKVFFPAADEAVSILVTLGTFGISFWRGRSARFFSAPMAIAKAASKRSHSRSC